MIPVIKYFFINQTLSQGGQLCFGRSSQPTRSGPGRVLVGSRHIEILHPAIATTTAYWHSLEWETSVHCAAARGSSCIGSIMIHVAACPVVQNCALTGRVPEDLPSCRSDCFYFTLSYGPLLLTNLRSLLPCELACYVHQYLRIYFHSNLMLRILILSVVLDVKRAN